MKEKGEPTGYYIEHCDKCGKAMTDKNGESIIGMSIEVQCMDDKSSEFVKKQVGKYEIGRRYQICWECWIDNMLGK